MHSDFSLPAAKTSSCPEKRQQVLDIATELFWRDGYEGVSIDEIVKASGQNRYTIYQAFGGKKELYLAALDGYYETGKQTALALLSSPDLPAFEAIRHIILSKVHSPEMARVGCFMTSTAVELAPKHSDIAERMQGYMGEIKGFLQGALSRAQAEGDIDPAADTGGLAEILYALFISAGVQSRMGVPPERLAKILDGAVTGLQLKKPLD